MSVMAMFQQLWALLTLAGEPCRPATNEVSMRTGRHRPSLRLAFDL